MTEKKNVVLHRGWGVVGDYGKDGTEVIIRDAGVIRRWGR
jgi:hypothetical protein